MNWTVGNTNSGSVSSVTSFTPTLPSSLSDGDLVFIATAYTPDDGSRQIECATANWYKGPSNAAYCVYARYSPAISAPTITVTGGLTVSASWFAASFRPTKQSFFGKRSEETGAPPASTTISVVSLDTLIVCMGVTPGAVSSWVTPSGFTTQRNVTGGPSVYFGYSIKTSTGDVTGIRVYDSASGAVRNVVISAAEVAPQMFFENI